MTNQPLLTDLALADLQKTDVRGASQAETWAKGWVTGWNRAIDYCMQAVARYAGGQAEFDDGTEPEAISTLQGERLR